MIKTHLKRFWIALSIYFCLFFMSIILGKLGCAKLALITFYALFPIFLYGYYHCIKYVFLGHKKIWHNLKNNKKDIFDLDDN